MEVPMLILQLRATMFLPKFIWYNEEHQAKYIDLLPGARVKPFVDLSSLTGNMPLPPGTMPAEYGPWQISAGKFSLSFQPNRIDILCNHLTNDFNLVKEFVEMSKNICQKVLERENTTALRLAYAPTKGLDLHNGDIKKFYTALPRVNTFEGEAIKNVEMKSVYRVKKSFGSKECDVNFRSEISQGTRQDANRPGTEEFIIMSLDINTFGMDNQFAIEDVKDFFNRSVIWDKDFDNNLFNGI